MVPNDVWALLLPDPAIEALEQERARLKGGQFRIKGSQHEGAVKHLTTLISTRRATWKKTVPKQYRLYYFQNRTTTWDLERQAYGEVPVEDKKHPRVLHLPERAALARLLCDQPNDLNPEELHQRRIEVGSSMVRLGRLRERIRPEIQGFLALLPPLRARFPVSMTAQLTELRPHPLLLPLPLRGPAAHASCYSNSSLVAPCAPGPALSNGSTLTHSSISSLDYDQSQGLAAYSSSCFPGPPPPSSQPTSTSRRFLRYRPTSATLALLSSFFPAGTCPRRRLTYQPSHDKSTQSIHRLCRPPASMFPIPSTRGYVDANTRYYFDTHTYAAPQQQLYIPAQMYAVDRWETTATCVY
jgi:hypothetical protein